MHDKAQIGFLGLGQMGAPMAERLLGDDVDLHVFDVSDSTMAAFVVKGAIAHCSPRSVADSASLIMACLPSGDICEQAALGEEGVAHGNAVKIHVEMSTIGRARVERIASGLAAHGIQTVDAPITGGPPAARDGTLAMLASGDEASLATVTPWLGRIGQSIHILGSRPGQAQIMKLINNMVMATNMVAASEGLVMGAKAGLDPDVMTNLLQSGTGSSWSAGALKKVALSGSFDFGARMSIVAKDVALGLREAASLDMPMPVVEAACRLWAAMLEAGHHAEDFTTIIKAVEQQAGCEVRSRQHG